MDPYFDSDNLFDRPLTSAQMSSKYPSKQQHNFNLAFSTTRTSAINNNASQSHMFDCSTFRQFDQYPFGFSYDPGSMESNGSAYFSPNTHATSRTPSVCGDAPQEADSPNLSPPITMEESPDSPESPSNNATAKPPLRKRGRPGIGHSSADSKLTRSQRSGRLPHNQVERKYREGLNSELERLRKAVPSLLQCDEGGGMSQSKPSKAMVLSSAIEYIRMVEKERDALKEENERLKQGQGIEAQQHGSWKDDRSLNEFLIDA